jgi:nucleotide-binding universal stress UspA family protein
MRNILAAAGFKDDRKVLKRAARLAREQSARLTILSVAEDLWLEAADISQMPEVSEAREEALAIARQDIEKLAASSGLAAASFDVRAEVGKAPDTILKVAEEIAADVIVVGAGRRRTLVEKVLGSTADRIVRSSAVPVLVVKDPDDGPYRHVMAAIDLSQSSPFVARTAVDIHTEGAVELVHAVEVALALEQAFLRSATLGGRVSDYKTALIAGAKERLSQLAAGLDARHEPRIRAVSGDPIAVLMRLSAREGPNLIVASRHSKGALERMLLGSVAMRLLRQCRCDILIAPAPGA